jgi:gliding motility-associated-like protein
MERSVIIGCLLALEIAAVNSIAQPNVAGFWLGVTYPTDPKQAIYNYTMTLTQSGSTIGGTAQTSNPLVPFGGVAYINGTANGNTVTFGESDKNGSTTVKNVCFWQGTLTYNPVDESLIGTYSSIVNGTTCTESSGGKVELYRIVLKSGTMYCKGTPINLIVTGKNIRWYSSVAKTSLLATGNTYSPNISQTTTFYITQTLYQNESPPVPITVEVIDPVLTITPTNTGCDKTNGTLAVTATGATNWQYSLNGGSFQSTPLFTNLEPGSYTVVAKNSAGCQVEQSATITTDAGPVISNLVAAPPKCSPDNGEVSVVTAGGKAPLTYSIDYGVTYQSDPRFTKLTGGAYTVRVRDANGCEVNRAFSLPSFSPMLVQRIGSLPSSCGQPTGQAFMTTLGGTKPVQYSLNDQPFQPYNTFVGLAGGTYIIVARDSTGCTISQSVTVAASTGPQKANVRTTPEGCGQSNGAVAITSARNTGVLNYSLDGQVFQRSADFLGLKAGTYPLTTRDENGCSVTQLVDVPLDCPNTIYLPTAFSPNQDNTNDALNVFFPFTSLTIARFTVYDRWGAVLYSRANFVLFSGESVWDGQLNGQKATAGVYMYRLDCEFPDGTKTTYRESVSVLN